ncbi:hypothetical protein PIN31009_04385 [Pandoraea iniqua]|uniref:nucleotidyl transferase AbiEii/AbiGii toxin family protein n=1 Tax=Pandoraea iniqua TaxID=2508288 RepID=UPI001240A32A|nr:nucleotidyl transferase AbiEii/AbiGii toxin family protein [Pandoraea iniqua]VVE46219.1 hypothetical protein PIN31009_04385 [Pandoraea iniqua]
MVSIGLRHALPANQHAMLSRVAREAARLGIEWFVAGATARDILLHYQFGFRIQRASFDVDIAMLLPDWEMFSRMSAALVATGEFHATPQRPERLRFVAKGLAPLPVDLLPFGNIADADHRIAWPPDWAIMMRVAGYAEAHSTSLSVALEEGVSMRVASIPGLTSMKLVAWRERGHENGKDAIDLRQLLETYAEAGNLDRLYGEEMMTLMACDYDQTLAGACLLGKDIRTILGMRVRDEIETWLADGKLRDRLIIAMVSPATEVNHAYSHCERLVDQLAKGLNDRL